MLRARSANSRTWKLRGKYQPIREPKSKTAAGVPREERFLFSRSIPDRRKFRSNFSSRFVKVAFKHMSASYGTYVYLRRMTELKCERSTIIIITTLENLKNSKKHGIILTQYSCIYLRSYFLNILAILQVDTKT